MRARVRARPRLAQVARGVTLIEILTALAVLAFGLAAIVALFLTSVQTSHIAVDQNAAALLIPEALKQIEREHKITDAMAIAAGDSSRAGEFIETLNYGFPASNSDTTSFPGVQVGAIVKGGLVDLADSNGGNFGFWPHEDDRPRMVAGTPYRLRYRLERFPGDSATDANRWYWHEDASATYDPENPSSPYRGVYLLTVVCYRQTRLDVPPADLLSAMVQVSDPVVVQLCDRKAR